MIRIVLAIILACVASRPAIGAAAELGKIGEYKLVDTAGTERTQADWRDAKAVVYCFLGTECPVSNGYAPQMQRLAEQYTAQGAAFVGVYVEPTVTADEARKHGEEYALKFPRLLDPAQGLIDKAGVKTMPTAVVARPDGTIVYRGRIDDRWSPEGKRRDVPRTHELADAIEAVLVGKSPPVAETPTFGCPVPKRK
jgi:peroxiredoxin